MTAPPRREQRRTHLDAAAVPIEAAILARAQAADDLLKSYEGSEWTPYAVALTLVRDEFRKLAEELHWW